MYLLLVLELVDQVLVFIEMIFSHSKQVYMHHFVRRLFPSHECNSKSSFVLIDQLELQPVKNLFVVADCIFPDEDGLVGNIAVAVIALAEYMKLLPDSAVFNQTFSPVFKCLFLRDFLI